MQLLKRFSLLPSDLRLIIMKMIPGTFNVCKRYRELLRKELNTKSCASSVLALPPTKVEIQIAWNNLKCSSISFINKNTKILHIFEFVKKGHYHYIYYKTQNHNEKIIRNTILYRGKDKKHYLESKNSLIGTFINKYHQNLIYPSDLLTLALQNRPYININIPQEVLIYTRQLELEYPDFFAYMGYEKLGYIYLYPRIFQYSYQPVINWKAN